MEVQEIKITIDPDGQVRVEVLGVKGQSCLDLTSALEEALGGEILSRIMTSEAIEDTSDSVEIPPHLETRG